MKNVNSKINMMLAFMRFCC